MKILVFNGSPKRDKSDTMCITRAFLEGMGEQEVKVLHAIEQNVKPCLGCFACMHNGGRCVQDDDMRGILEEILASDLLIFSYPLYCYGMPATLKAIIDRILPLSKMTMEKVGDRYEHVGQADYSHLRYIMICGCGFPTAGRTSSLLWGSSSSCSPAAIPSSPCPRAPCSTCPARRWSPCPGWSW